MSSSTSRQRVCVAGAGFSGAVIARVLADAGHQVCVYDSRDHVAGNCHTKRDDQTGVMLHLYGPHIFHTDNETVWRFVNRFDELMPYVNRVKAVARNRVYSLPINLLTINQFFGKAMSPKEARSFVESISDTSIGEPHSFEEWALRHIGRELYETFFEGYTLKQWGIHPSELSASIIKRLKLSFNYDDNYFRHRYQGIPRNGYTKIIERILEHKSIDVHLGTTVGQGAREEFDHVFYSGAVDAWHEKVYGSLDYRTLEFEPIFGEGDYQGCAVMNYCDSEVPWTRITEHRHFAPWEQHDKTICFREYSRQQKEGDIPFYPVRLLREKATLKRYVDLAAEERKVTFVGRLGTYRYLDMDVTVKEALDVADRYLGCLRSGEPIPAFNVDPLG